MIDCRPLQLSRVGLDAEQLTRGERVPTVKTPGDGRTWRRGLLAVALPVVVLFAVTGCGSSSSSHTGTSAGTAAAASTASADASTTASGGDDYLTKVKSLVAAGQTDFLYNPDPDLTKPLDPNAVVVLKPGEWRGPTSAPKVTPGKKVEVISCAAGSACDTAAQGVMDAGKALGWKMHFSASDATPSGDVRAFNAALTAKPDAIVGVALSQSVIGQPMAAAHKQGVKVVGIALPQTVPPPNGYDATAPAPSGAAAQVEMWSAMADADGKANIGYMWDKASGTLASALEMLQKQITNCSGCTSVDPVNHAYATCNDPVAMARLTTSMIQRNPDMQYILTPYGCGTPGMVNGVKSSPNPNVKILSENGEKEQVAAVAAGQLFADVGFSLNQMGWTGADALVRLFAGEKALPIEKQGVVMKLFTKANAPADGNFDWAKAFPFEQEYKKAWGVG
jgi:ribose transport system substrate-binding protein